MKAVVIGGFGRSGTSLIRNWMIDQPGVISFGKTESKFFVEPYGLLDLFRAYVTDFSYSRAVTATEEFLALMLDHLVDARFTGQPSLIARIHEDYHGHYVRAVRSFAASLKERDVPIWHDAGTFYARARRLVHELLALIAGEEIEGQVFVEKTPHNALNPEIFTHLFDDPRFVWLVRDPRAVTYSTSKMDWGPQGLDAAMFYVKQVVRRYLAMRHRYGGYEVRLEDMETNQPSVVAGLTDYCGIAVRAEREPFEAAVLHDWENYLDGADLDRVSGYLQEEIRALGYR